MGQRVANPRASNSDAGSNDDRRSTDRNRLVQTFEDAMGDRSGLIDISNILEQHRELVSADSRYDIGATRSVEEALRDHLQDAVAGTVPKRVIDRLEFIQIDVEHCHRRAIRAAALPGSFEVASSPIE